MASAVSSGLERPPLAVPYPRVQEGPALGVSASQPGVLRVQPHRAEVHHPGAASLSRSAAAVAAGNNNNVHLFVHLIVQAQFTQDAEHLATCPRKLWNTLQSIGVFTQVASNIKFACKCANASCVNLPLDS